MDTCFVVVRFRFAGENLDELFVFLVIRLHVRDKKKTLVSPTSPFWTTILLYQWCSLYGLTVGGFYRMTKYMRKRNSTVTVIEMAKIILVGVGRMAGS